MRKTRLGQARHKSPGECFKIASAIMDVKCHLLRAESSSRSGGTASVRKHLDSALKDSFRLKQLYPEGSRDVDRMIDETMELKKKIPSLDKKPKPGSRAEFALGIEKTLSGLHLILSDGARACNVT